MALTVGELNAYIRAENGEFVRVLNESGGRIVALRRVVDVQAAAINRAFNRINPTINVDVDMARAQAALDDIERRVVEIGRLSPTVTAHADVARAITQLDAVRTAERRVGDDNSADRAGSRFARLASSLGGLVGSLGRVAGQAGLMAAQLGAVIPVAAGLAATLVNIAPAAAIGATAVLSLVSAVAAIKIGTGGLGSAFKAAFAPAVSGGGGAAKATNQAADAQRALQRATQNAADSNRQAVQQVASAERDLTAAQRVALIAQGAINDARGQATRDLQDLNNSLADARNSEKAAGYAVQDAAAALRQAKVSGDSDAIGRAQLAYDQATQALTEQQLQVQRLTKDTKDANTAGVEGSKTVVDAKKAEADAVQDVRDKTLALSNTQLQQARTAQQGADAILQAREALAQAGAAAGGGAGGVDAFAAAMARLAPNARSFVREVVSLGPAWRALQLGVQQRLFAGLAGSLAATAAVGLPVLRKGLEDSAGALNRMGLGVLGAARNLAADGTLGKALKGASTGLSNLSGIPGLVVTAFGQLSAAAAPQFDKLTKSLAGGAQSLADKLGAAFTSGGLGKAIDTAVNLIKQIGSVLGDVGSILGSVMGAAQASGGGWLGVLKDISSAMRVAFASPEVQDALHALFSTMATLGTTVAPLLVQALGVIAPVLTALGPPVKLLITSLGAALKPVIAALGPILVVAAKAVGQLITALAPLLPIIGDLIAAVLPILTPVLKALGTIFGKLAGPVQQVAKALGTALKPVIAGLAVVVDDLVTRYMGVFMTILGDLIPLVPQLTPTLIQLGVSLGRILTAVAPLLPQMMLLGVTMLTQLLPAIIPLIPPLAQLTTMLLILATDVITGVVVPALSGLITFFSGLKKAFKPALDAVTWLTTAISKAFEWLADHLVGHSVIPDMIRSIVGWFAGLPGKAWNALANLGGNLAGRAQAAANRMVTAVKNGVSSAVWWVGTLPSRVFNVLGDLSGYLWNSGQALIGGFIGGIKSMLGAAGDAASSVLGYVKGFFPNSPALRGPFSGKGWTYHSGLATAVDYIAGMDAQRGAAGRSAAALMGAAHDGLAAPGSSDAALIAPPSRAGGGAATGAGYGGGRGVLDVRVTVDTKGAGSDDLAKLLSKWIRVQAGSGPGSVQSALGQS